MANSRKFCANKLSTKVNLQAFRFPAVFRLVVALGNRLKETILILAFQSTLQLQFKQRKLLNELKSATPQPTEAKRNMAVKMEVKLRCVRNVFFKRISVLNIQLSEFST